MEIKATAKFIRISARKARLVADLIRGLPVEEARLRLKFSDKKAGSLLAKVLDTAIANATNNSGKNIASLYVARVLVDEGPTLRRVRFVSRGRAHRIRKRLTHMTVWLGEREVSPKASLTVPDDSGTKKPTAQLTRRKPLTKGKNKKLIEHKKEKL